LLFSLAVDNKEHGIPVINLFYDGLRSPNENLEPYVFYLRQKKASSPPIT